MMKTVKVNYILDAHNNGGKNLKLLMQKSFKIGPKMPMILYQHIKIAKNLLKGSLAAIVFFLKTPEI